MSTHKILDKAGAACGCEYSVDKANREMMIKMCQAHKAEYDTRHAAAASSCSHANRDLVDTA